MKSFDRPRTGNLRVAKRLTQGPSTVKGSDRQSVGGFVRYEKGVLRLAPSRSPDPVRARSAAAVHVVESGPDSSFQPGTARQTRRRCR